LAVELAREFGLTLLAFARGGVANQYAPIADDSEANTKKSEQDHEAGP